MALTLRFLFSIFVFAVAGEVASQESLFDYRSESDRVANGIEVDGANRKVPFIILLRPKPGLLSIRQRCGAAVIDPEITATGIRWRTGKVINPEWAITAAHCLVNEENIPYDPSQIYASGGQLGIGPDAGFTADIEAMIFHPSGFNILSGENDIAVIRLKNVVHSENELAIRSIRLDNTDGALLSPYNSLFVAGWGKSADGSRPEYLFEAQLPVVDRSTCKTALATASEQDDYAYELLDTMICAGFASGGYDACAGDSGGPLFYRPPLAGAGRWGEPILAGIVSWSPGSCNRVGQFGIYTYVEPFTPWIGTVISEYIR